MGYVTASAIWPTSSPSADIKQLVDRFFTLADLKDDDVGERFATEIFTKGGVFTGLNGTFEGSSEISKSRKDAWKVVKSRRHEVLKVFSNDNGTTDLLVIGLLTTETLDGVRSSKEFVARMEIEQVGSGGPRMCQYRIVSPEPQGARPLLSTRP